MYPFGPKCSSLSMRDQFASSEMQGRKTEYFEVEQQMDNAVSQYALPITVAAQSIA